MDKLKPMFDKVEAVFVDNEDSPVAKAFTLGQDKTGVPRFQLAIGASAVGFLLTFWLLGLGLLYTLIATLYPSFRSLKAIESKTGMHQWLVYWVVFGAFSILEHFADTIMFWLPFFFECKILLLVWCMYPMEQNGAQVIYEKFVRAKLLNAEEDTVQEAVADDTKEE